MYLTNLAVDFYPGYTTSIYFLNKNIFINIGVKNKILSKMSCLDLIEDKLSHSRRGANVEEDIREMLVHKSVKTLFNRKNYVVEDIDFKKNPSNTTFMFQDASVTIQEYYKKHHKINIDGKQPLIVCKSNIKNKEETIYIPPELCVLSGLTDEMRNDGNFMKELANFTKLTPKGIFIIKKK